MPRLHQDAAFSIGKTHAVCQDYALATSPPANENADVMPLHAVWLSDGCSSSPHTDMGARLLVHTMQTQTARFDPVFRAQNGSARRAALRAVIGEAVGTARQSAAGLGVPTAALDATLLGLVCEAESGILHAFGWGDGALVLGFDNGFRTIYRVQFGAGYPFYPVYETHAGRKKSWEAVPSNARTITETRLRPDGIVESERVLPQALGGETLAYLRVQTKGLRFAAVLSDGVESLQKRSAGETSATFDAVSPVEAVRELTAFKQFKGDFVQRRMQAFEKNCAKWGWHHNDDVSVAALFLGDV